MANRNVSRAGVLIAILVAVGFAISSSKTSEQTPAQTIEEQNQQVVNEPEQGSIPEKVDHAIPFASQAPFGEWDDDRFQDGCEEASVFMAMHWVRGDTTLTPQEMKDEIIKMSAWEEEKYGSYHDTSAEDTAKRLVQEYFGHSKVSYKHDIDVEDIKKELAAGKLVIVPADGQVIGNPNFTAPGPERHMILIKGYDDRRGEFITNDPGTRRGKDYRYKYNQLINAVRDYPSGDHQPITEKRTAMVVMEK